MARKTAAAPTGHPRTAVPRKRRAPASAQMVALALIWPGASFTSDDLLFLDGKDWMGPIRSLRDIPGPPSERPTFKKLPRELRLLLTIPAKTRSQVFWILERVFSKEIERAKWKGGRGPRNIGDPKSKRYAKYQQFLALEPQGYTAWEMANMMWPPDRESAPGEWVPKDPVQLIQNWRRRARQRGELPPVRA